MFEVADFAADELECDLLFCVRVFTGAMFGNATVRTVGDALSVAVPSTGHFFSSKYTATHEQVTRSAPSRDPSDSQNHTLTPEKTKMQGRGTPC